MPTHLGRKSETVIGESMWTNGRVDVWRSGAMSLEVEASQNSVEEKRREGS